MNAHITLQQNNGARQCWGQGLQIFLYRSPRPIKLKMSATCQNKFEVPPLHQIRPAYIRHQSINMFQKAFNLFAVLQCQNVIQAAREKLAAGGRKFIYINSFLSVSILQIVVISAQNNQLIVVITFTKYNDSTVNTT